MASQDEIRVRQDKIYRLHLKKLTNTEIANILGISDDTVAKDIKAKKARLGTQARASKNLAKTIEEEKDAIDQVIMSGWLLYDKSKDKNPAVAAGALRTILQAHKQRAELLGLDAPQKVEHSGPAGGPIETVQMTPEERRARIDELLQKIQGGPGGGTSSAS